MSSKIACVSLIKPFLLEKLNENKSFSETDDTNVAINLFAEIFYEIKITEKKFIVEMKINSLKEDSKVQSFVNRYFSSFEKICKSGFPFSLVNNLAARKIIKNALTQEGSLLADFMMLEDVRLLEDDLNQKYGYFFKSLKTEEIKEACCVFIGKYIQEGNHKAGDYLLWVIKKFIGGSYYIPPEENLKVEEILSKSIFKSKIQFPERFIELLFFYQKNTETFLFEELLEDRFFSNFFDFTINTIVDLSIEKWPKKKDIIVAFLSIVGMTEKFNMANRLKNNMCFKTSSIGVNLLEALNAKTVKDGIKYYNKLCELLPLRPNDIEVIFGRPFINFDINNKEILNSDALKQSLFNLLSNIFIQDEFVVGVYNSETIFEGEKLPPYLLAYDVYLKKMLWALPLTSAFFEEHDFSNQKILSYRLQKVNEVIFIQFAEKQEINFIQIQTGECYFTLSMFYSHNNLDCFHITSQYILYQMVDMGKGCSKLLIDKRMVNRDGFVLKIDSPNGVFKPFSTHVGFHNNFNNSLFLVGPTGYTAIIENCLSAKAIGDKFYSIGENKDKYRLTVRTLLHDKKVVSEIEHSIDLDVEAFFGALYENEKFLAPLKFSNGKTQIVQIKQLQVIVVVFNCVFICSHDC
jgi:hypothetical protein